MDLLNLEELINNAYNNDALLKENLYIDAIGETIELLDRNNFV